MAMDTDAGFSSADFAATASRAVAACGGLSFAEQNGRLAADGLLGVIATENVGGLGLPLSFAVPVVAAANAGLAAFPIMESILAARLIERQLPRVAAAIVAGTESVTIAWKGSVNATRNGDQVVLDGPVGCAPCLAEAGLLLLRVGESGAALVPAESVVRADASGIDLTLPEYSAILANVSVPADHLLADDAWLALEADALVLRAASILGAAETCLGMAQEHVTNRRQFGRALSFNQAIRHALARYKLCLEGIRQSIARALFPETGLRERRAAFVAAANSGVFISEGAIQMHGGMGFTWDIPVHHYVRRIRALQAQGDASELLFAIGRDFIAEVAPAVA